MPDDGTKKIVYLFGAGATHAELQALDPDLVERKQQGLLISDVSSRVISEASSDRRYLRDVETVSGTKGSLNIELLISLIESSKVHGWEYKTGRLKRLVQKDIERILSKSRSKRFYLHRALFEFHGQVETEAREKLIGIISLNYDTIIDQAYKQYFGRPEYYISAGEADSKAIPLLKLHGSFGWKKIKIRGRWRRIDIIPLGSSKNYLHAPYGFIWAQALKILVECDILRVVGCSLSPNDAHLVDLLFKAHLEKGKAMDIEIISADRVGEVIRRNYGFFPGIRSLVKIEEPLIADPDPPNPFREWLKHKTLRILGDVVKGHHLKKVLR